MLSLYAITTPQGMSTYYDSDGYYAKGDPDAQSASQWHGKGAAAANLEGFVTPEASSMCLTATPPTAAASGAWSTANGNTAPGWT
ncbi:hypothetical protein JCM17844_28270 [Iodidimonas gelatinilytica]|uniref:Uncharacterized protein n=1 Tax=Iodidimonas gelatinilytica TaxID=1236966 RepID=A0A5A7MTF9_9PROT|nr:hypothetical protein JCM17844_28270 [Iodidimonas gelatinilytica]